MNSIAKKIISLNLTISNGSCLYWFYAPQLLINIPKEFEVNKIDFYCNRIYLQIIFSHNFHIILNLEWDGNN